MVFALQTGIAFAFDRIPQSGAAVVVFDPEVSHCKYPKCGDFGTVKSHSALLLA